MMVTRFKQINFLKHAIFHLGTNLISELFSTMTTRMRFTDVWNLVLGNPVGSRINEARQSATEYLQLVYHMFII